MTTLIDQLNYTPLIIPTVLIPFTLVSVGISIVATFIAGLFGVELKAEGPKQLLEVLLRPKVIITAIIFNIIGMAAFKGYIYIKNQPSFIFTINSKNSNSPSSKSYNKLTQEVRHYGPMKNSFIPKDTVLKWETKLSSSSFRLGIVNNDSLFIAQNNGTISEVSLDDGEILRSFFTGTMIAPRPTIVDDFLYSGEGAHETHMARTYKIDLKTGKHVGQFQSKGHIEGPITYAKHNKKKLLFISAGKDGVYAINPETMEKVWQVNPGHTDASVTVKDDLVYVGTGREKGDAKKYRTFVAAFNFHTGNEVWKNETPLSTWMAPVIWDKHICYISGEVYFASKLGYVNCYDRSTGEPSLSVAFRNPLIGQPLSIGQLIIVSDLYGKVCAIDIKNRIKSWCNNQAESESPVMNTATYDQHKGILAFASPKQGVLFLDPVSGKTLYQYQPKDWKPSSVSDVIFTDNGFITIGNRGVLRRLSWQNK